MKKTGKNLKAGLVYITILALTLTGPFVEAQQKLSIETCYKLAINHYPLVQRQALIEQAKLYSLENAARGYLPQLNINGQGSYQSEVTAINIPNVKTPVLSKDQYRIYGELYQSFTDGATIRKQQELAKATAETENQQVEVELYKLKDRINQLFFGILLIETQIVQNDLLKKDIRAGIDKTNAAIANGAALKSNADNLKAELLKTDQRTIELQAGRKGYADMLAIFIGQAVNENTILAPPEPKASSQAINRPELKLYDLQKKGFDIQTKLITKKNLPRLGLFLQGGYGRPGLNMLSNDFSIYYIGGLKLNWNVSGLYTAKKERAILKLSQQTIEVQKETFLFNTNLSLLQQNSEVNKYRQLLETDNEIISLREKVKLTAKSQLENGTITINDYLIYVNAEDQARQNLLLHQVQLTLARYNYQTTSGN